MQDVTITREFAPANRYTYDFGLCKTANGFAQIDTSQDAFYFGTWASPDRRLIVNYCEGDVTLTECATDAAFIGQIREIERWNHEQGHGQIKIDPGFNPDLRAAFDRLGLGDLTH